MAHYEVLTINQGTDVSVELHLVNVDNSIKDLTGHSVTAKLGTHYDAKDSDKTSFLSIVANPATSGIVNLSLTNAVTAALNPKKRYVYDVEISHIDSDTSNTIVERVMEGLITVTPSVTT
jgi:hypothetical protein|tara:strand:- start:1102 stop:1461 length:360 start_codon:yes stop_codon:yes gene_type:complete